MANRFYQTTEGRFVDDKMYKAPWELMQAAINTHETRTDKLVNEAGLLTDAVDNIKFLDLASEKERVKALQDKYETQIKDLTETIVKNPLEYNRQMPALKAAQRAMQKDKLGGEWSQIEGRASAVAKWVEENKDKKSEDPVLYNRLYNNFIDKLETNLETDPNAKWQGSNVVTRPDLLKNLESIMKNIKGNATKYNDATGRWLVGKDELTEDEIHDMAVARLQSDPNFSNYSQQMKGLGDKGYDVSPYKYYNKETGEALDYADYSKLGLEERQKYQRGVNQEFAFASDLTAMGKIYGYQNIDLEANPYGVQAQKAADASRLSTQGFRQDMSKQNQDFLNDKEMARLKASLDKDKLLYAYNLERDGAEAAGDIETLDNIDSAIRAHKVVTIGEQGEMGKKYVDLHTKAAAGKTLTPQEQIDYNKLQSLYSGFAKTNANDILRAAGEDPSSYEDTPDGNKKKLARASKLTAEIMALKDSGWGIKTKHLPYDPKRTFGSSTVTDYSERRRVEAIQSALTKSIGDFDEKIADNMVITRGFMPANLTSQIGKVGMGLVNSLDKLGIEPIVQDINLLSYDPLGNKRGGTNVTVDKNWSFNFGKGASSNPMQELYTRTGTSSPQELVTKGYGQMNWRQERGDYIIDFVPNNSKLKEAGVDTSDWGWKEEGFSLRYSNVPGDVWENFKGMEGMDNATIRQMRLHSDETYSEAAQNVDLNIAAIKAKGPTASYAFEMGGIPETLFKIEYDPEEEKYILMKSWNQDKELSWETLKEQGLFDYTTSPDVLKLFLREQVIENNKPEKSVIKK